MSGGSNIGVISDLHIGTLDGPMLPVLEDYVESIDDSEIGLLLVLGDVLHEGHETPSNVLADIVDIFDYHVDAEVIFQAGNHDALELSRGAFYNTVGNEPRTVRTVGETDVIVVDTAYGGTSAHAGLFSEYDYGYVQRNDRAARTIVASHFPLLYTEAYQDSGWFYRYPEGVFALGKHRLEMGLMDDEVSVQGVISGHLHPDLHHVWEDDETGVFGWINRPYFNVEEQVVDEQSYKTLSTDPEEWL